MFSIALTRNLDNKLWIRTLKTFFHQNKLTITFCISFRLQPLSCTTSKPHFPQIVSCLAALALAEPEADPYYGYYGHGLLAHGNTLVGPGGLSPAWPTTVGLGFQSTVYGARGKRSADADADAYYGYGYGLGYGLAYHGGHATSYTHRSPQGLSLRHGLYYGKRSADPAYHPYGLVLSHNNNVYSGFTGNHYATGLPGHSFAAVTHLGKREAEPTADADAEAEADPYYGYYGYGRRYGYGLGYRGYYGHGYGLGYGYGYYG